MRSFQNRFALASLVACVASLGSTQAFAPNTVSTPTATRHIHHKIPSITTTRALPLDQLGDAAISWDQIQQSASQFLADDAAVAAAGEATGWWGSYINLFKSTLLWVHGNIDGPLRSVGFDQTWGVSIALFTLSK